MQFFGMTSRVLCLTLVLSIMACSSNLNTNQSGWWGSRQDSKIISDDDIRRFVAGIRPLIRNPEFHFRQGLYLQARENHEAAIEEFRKVLMVEPDHIKALNAMAISSDRTGDFDNALRSYNKALSLNEDLDYVFNNLGYSYFLQGNYTSSIRAFERAVELNPENLIYNNNLGMAYSKKGEFKKALARFEREPSSASVSKAETESTDFLNDEKKPVSFSRESCSMIEYGKITEYRALGSNVKSIKDRPTIQVLTSREITEPDKSEILGRIDKPTTQMNLTGSKAETGLVQVELEKVLRGSEQILPEMLQVGETIQPERFKKSENILLNAQNSYTVQVGAFKYRENVESIYFRLFDKGYCVYIDGPTDDEFYRVRVGEFSTLKKARRAAKTLAREEHVETFPATSNRMIADATAMNKFLPASGKSMQDRHDHDRKALEIINGNGVKNMARRMGNYLEGHGYQITRISDADHFGHPRTTIYYLPGYGSAADILANKIAGDGRLRQVDFLALSNSDMRMVLGKDLVDYESMLDSDPIIEKTSILTAR